MTFESSHDVARLGQLTAAGNPSIELVSLADLVRFFMRPVDESNDASGLPLRAAAAKVIDGLERAEMRPTLYATQRADFARPVAVACHEQHGRREWFSARGVLQRLRDAWERDATSGDDLAREPFARLAIRADTAEVLFGYGPARSFWEGLPVSEERASVLAAADRWGAAITSNGEALVRLAELVDRVTRLTSLVSVKSAAEKVLETIEGAVPLSFYMLTPGEVARGVTDSDVWRRRYPPGREMCEWPYFAEGNKEDELEAALRGLDLGITYDRSSSQVAALPELPQLAGAAGLVEWLRWCWVNRAERRDDLNEGLHAAAAIPLEDALRLFGQVATPDGAFTFLLASSEEAKQTATVLQLAGAGEDLPASAAQDVQSVLKSFASQKKHGEEWTDAALLELLRQHTVLTSVPYVLKVAVSHEELGEVWNLSANSVKTFLTRARKVAVHARKAA
jgi:hypothetical protein